MNLPSLSIHRPVFAAMLIMGLVVLGIVSLTRLDIDLNPDVDFPFILVNTVLRGAAPETVEREISDVLEEEINTIEGIRTLWSVSYEGLSSVRVEFELGYNVDVKAQQVRDKVAVARPRLPLDIEDPVVERLDPDSMPIISVMLGGPLSIRELSEVAEHVVAERLERLPGVGNVQVVGGRDREIRIWLNPVRLTGYGLSVGDVASMLRRENAELAGGRIEGPAREWAVTTAGKVKSAADFASLIVAERRGHLVYLRDVAVVEDGMEEERSIARLNGQRGVSLEVRRQSGANTVSVARAVRAEVEALRAVLPAGMTMTIAKDLAIFIEKDIRAVFEDMVFGGFLAVVVVLLFLRNPRSTLIAALAIPSSVIGSFTLFYIAGFTLNTMSLMALSLCIGLLIDDAIVVVENIFRRMERGEPRMAAAEAGATQVLLAVIATTLAVCAVFVPIAFMEGMVGEWFYQFGMVVVFAVSVSALVAFTLTPMLASRILVRDDGSQALWRVLERGYSSLDEGYRWLLIRAVRRKGITVAIGVAAVVGALGIAWTLPLSFYSEGDRGEFRVRVKLPLGTPLSVTSSVVRTTEEVIAEEPEVRTVFSTIGAGLQRQANEASTFVAVTDKHQRDRSQIEIMDALRAKLVAAVPEADEIEVAAIGWVDFGDRSSLVQYSLRGPDLARLNGYAQELLDRMRSDPTFVDVTSSFETGKPEIALEMDRARAADLGVPATLVGRTIRTLLAGEKVGSYEEGGRRYDVRVQILPEYRDDPSKLNLIYIRSLRGELVPITNVVHLRHGEGAVEIRRENRARQIILYANLVGDTPLGLATGKLDVWGAELGIVPPDELVPTARVRAMWEAVGSIGFAFLLAPIAIYMILASLFNSFIHPFTIMTAAPLSFIGGFLALKLAGMPIDLMSGIGLLVLMGLVMKNGILLVDYTNQLRAAGRSREEAVLEAGPIRMRPVLMTTGALIFGMLPVALGRGAGAEFRSPMGMVVVGGLITSTLLTLVVVPVIYLLLDQIPERLRAVAQRLLLRGRKAPGTSEPSAG
jgi:HAE1 family hydrophobic/amphiphilic exporter-1